MFDPSARLYVPFEASKPRPVDTRFIGRIKPAAAAIRK